MLLTVKELFTGEKNRLPITMTLDLSDTELDGVKPFLSPIQVTGEASHHAEGVHLDLRVFFTYCVPCDRCTVPVKRGLEYHFSHELVLELNHDDNEEYIAVTDYKLDLDELVRADILLELPTKNLCKADCKGLCLKCGANLNSESCGCDTRQIDSRLEILKQLIDD